MSTLPFLVGCLYGIARARFDRDWVDDVLASPADVGSPTRYVLVPAAGYAAAGYAYDSGGLARQLPPEAFERALETCELPVTHAGGLTNLA